MNINSLHEISWQRRATVFSIIATLAVGNQIYRESDRDDESLNTKTIRNISRTILNTAVDVPDAYTYRDGKQRTYGFRVHLARGTQVRAEFTRDTTDNKIERLLVQQIIPDGEIATVTINEGEDAWSAECTTWTDREAAITVGERNERYVYSGDPSKERDDPVAANQVLSALVSTAWGLVYNAADYETGNGLVSTPDICVINDITTP